MLKKIAFHYATYCLILSLSIVALPFTLYGDEASSANLNAQTQTAATGAKAEQLKTTAQKSETTALQQQNPGQAAYFQNLADAFGELAEDAFSRVRGSDPYIRSYDSNIGDSISTGFSGGGIGSLSSPAYAGASTPITPILPSQAPFSDKSITALDDTPKAISPPSNLADNQPIAVDNQRVSAPPYQPEPDYNSLLPVQPSVNNPLYNPDLNPVNMTIYAANLNPQGTGTNMAMSAKSERSGEPVPQTAQEGMRQVASLPVESFPAIYETPIENIPVETPSVSTPAQEPLPVPDVSFGEGQTITADNRPAARHTAGQPRSEEPAPAHRITVAWEDGNAPDSPDNQDNTLNGRVTVSQQTPYELADSLQISESDIQGYLVKLLGNVSNVNVTKTVFEDSRGEVITMYYVSIDSPQNTSLIIYAGNGRILGVKFMDNDTHVTGTPVYTPEASEFYSVAENINSALTYKQIAAATPEQEPAVESAEQAVPSETPAPATEPEEKTVPVIAGKAPVSAVEKTAIPQLQPTQLQPVQPDLGVKALPVPKLNERVESTPAPSLPLGPALRGLAGAGKAEGLPQEGRMLFEQLPVTNRSVWLF